MKEESKKINSSYLSQGMRESPGSGCPSSGTEMGTDCTVLHRGIDPYRLTPAAAEEIIHRLRPILESKKRRREI